MHTELFKTRRVWAILVLLTLISVVIAERLHQPWIVLVSAFGLAAVKGNLIAIHFMETRQARTIWNALYRTWIVAIASLLLLGNLFAPHG